MLRKILTYISPRSVKVSKYWKIKSRRIGNHCTNKINSADILLSKNENNKVDSVKCECFRVYDIKKPRREEQKKTCLMSWFDFVMCEISKISSIHRHPSKPK